MKKGDHVWTATNHGVHEWIYLQPNQSFSGRPMAIVSDSKSGWQTNELVSKLYPTLRAAVTARIALLEKTRKSLLTSAENHRLMIAKLKRELRKETS